MGKNSSCGRCRENERSHRQPEDRIVIDTVLNRMFRCAHRHLTRPFTLPGEQGGAQLQTYVVCLDCTKQFAYDWKEMRIGQPIHRSHDAYVIPAGVPKARRTRLAYALGGFAVPAAVVLGAVFAARKPTVKKKSAEQPPESTR